MPRLVTKFKYIRPGKGKSPGGYAKYIATREGVEKIDDSHKNDPVSKSRKQLIGKLLGDFPDLKESPEYASFLARPTKGNATNFITFALDENAEDIVDSKTYADYIATRPGAEKLGTHGMFTEEGVPVHLEQVSEELNRYPGHVYTVILSLKREDAERLGFENGGRWRDFLRGQTETFATNFKIPMDHLKWYGAFHNAGHHPHVHLMIYSTVPCEGHLSNQGVEKIRSTLAREIFAQEMLCIYDRQTEYRDDLRHSGAERIAQLVSQINEGNADNPAVQALLVELAQRLSRTSGKKVYGYLKPDVKQIVDQIVAELCKDERIQELYALWYGQREEVLRTYTDTFPERIPLEQNPEFKTIRNAVIKEAMRVVRVEGPTMSIRTSAPDAPSEEEAPHEDRDWWRNFSLPEEPDIPREDPHEEPMPEDTEEHEEEPFVPPDTPPTPTYTPPIPPYVPPAPTPAPPSPAPVPMGASLRLLRSLARMVEAKYRQEQKQAQKPHMDKKQWQKIQEKKQALGMRD